MNVPQLAIGDGAMGFRPLSMGSIHRHVISAAGCTKQQIFSTLCPKHHSPKLSRRFIKSGRQRQINAEKAFELFIETYQDKYPKATFSLQKDREELLAFYDFPAKHWQSIRTGNLIDSTFDTIRHRTRISKGCLNRDGMLHMMFKLGQCAEKKWKKLRGFDYLENVIKGIKFSDGIEVIPEIRIDA